MVKPIATTPIFYSKKLIIILIGVTISIQVVCQSNNPTIVQFSLYNKNPITNEQNGASTIIKPFKLINLNISEIAAESVTDSCVNFSDKLNGIKLNICKRKFVADDHSYDFEKLLIDGKKVFGHDGFYTLDYVRTNFYNELNKICITNDTLDQTINIVNEHFPIFIHPYLSNDKGKSSIKVFRVKKFFQYLIEINGGGGGAGSYTNYILIDLYNRGWLFAKDLYSETVDFIPIAKQKYLFSPTGEKIWYNITFE